MSHLMVFPLKSFLACLALHIFYDFFFFCQSPLSWLSKFKPLRASLATWFKLMQAWFQLDFMWLRVETIKMKPILVWMPCQIRFYKQWFGKLKRLWIIILKTPFWLCFFRVSETIVCIYTNSNFSKCKWNQSFQI